MKLRLYIAGEGPNSIMARENLARAVSRAGAAEVPVEVVDCLTDAARALVDGVLVTPTLLLEGAAGQSSVIGTLSDVDRVSAVIRGQMDVG